MRLFVVLTTLCLMKESYGLRVECSGPGCQGEVSSAKKVGGSFEAGPDGGRMTMTGPGGGKGGGMSPQQGMDMMKKGADQLSGGAKKGQAMFKKGADQMQGAAKKGGEQMQGAMKKGQAQMMNQGKKMAGGKRGGRKRGVHGSASASQEGAEMKIKKS